MAQLPNKAQIEAAVAAVKQAYKLYSGYPITDYHAETIAWAVICALLLKE